MEFMAFWMNFRNSVAILFLLFVIVVGGGQRDGTQGCDWERCLSAVCFSRIRNWSQMRIGYLVMSYRLVSEGLCNRYRFLKSLYM